jgi:hypothetical protein
MKRRTIGTEARGDELFQLVRAARPVDDSAFAPTSKEGEAMFERTISAVRRAGFPRKALRFQKRRLVLATAAVIAVIAGGVGGAFAGGLISVGSGKVADVANQAASGRLVVENAARAASTSQKVTDLDVVAASANGNAGVVEGVQNGAHVSVVTNGSGTGLFAPTSKMLSWADGLYVQMGATGSSPDTVDELDISGIATAKTVTVNLIGGDGATKAVELNEMSDGAKAFAIAINPAAFKPTFVAAYGENGNELARKAIPIGVLTPPGNEG